MRSLTSFLWDPSWTGKVLHQWIPHWISRIWESWAGVSPSPRCDSTSSLGSQLDSQDPATVDPTPDSRDPGIFRQHSPFRVPPLALCVPPTPQLDLRDPAAADPRADPTPDPGDPEVLGQRGSLLGGAPINPTFLPPIPAAASTRSFRSGSSSGSRAPAWRRNTGSGCWSGSDGSNTRPGYGCRRWNGASTSSRG